MNFVKKIQLKYYLFYLKKEIRDKVSSECKEDFWIDIYGSYEINPKFLVILIAVKTDLIKFKLIENFELKNSIIDLVSKIDYFTNDSHNIQIYFESQETVNRESKGNWHIHLQ